MRYLAATVLCLLILSGFAWAMMSASPGTRSAHPVIPPGALHVVVSTPIAADLAKRVAGSDAIVSTIAGPGTDAHQYEPTPQDASLLSTANVIIMVGSGFDDWMTGLAKNARSKPSLLVLVDPKTHQDPHFWQDPTLASRAGLQIADALSQARPDSKPAFDTNAQALAKDLADLDAWIKTQVDTIPKENRKLFTPHDAMGYYASRYGFEVLPGLQGLSTSEETEPSAKRMSQIIQEIKAAGVPAIFAEAGPQQDADPHDHDHDHGHKHAHPGHSHTSNRLLARVAKDANVKVVLGLNTDTLGPPGSPTDTYIKLMQSNTRLIVETLAPPPAQDTSATPIPR
jgi:ABC-type Zn uptake system ZnuABC Zn-binding protein ZnuA